MHKLLSEPEITWAFVQFVLLGVTTNFYRSLFPPYLFNEFSFKAQSIGLVLAAGSIVNSLTGSSTGHFLDTGVRNVYFCDSILSVNDINNLTYCQYNRFTHEIGRQT